MRDLAAHFWSSIELLQLQLQTVASVISCLNLNVNYTPGVGTSVNVKSLPGVWGRPGVGLEIDKCKILILLASLLELTGP